MINFQAQKYFHVLVIPLSFVLNLYINNLDKVAFTNILRTIIVIVILTILVIIAFVFTSHSWEKAAILTSIFFLFFFNFNGISNPIIRLLEKADQFQTPQSVNQISLYLGIIFAIVYLLLSQVILRKDNVSRTLTRYANWFSIGLIGLFIGSMAYSNFQKINMRNLSENDNFYSQWQANLRSEPSLLKSSEQQPDIFYIVLDGYGRADVLERHYEIDNRLFLDSLTDLGFMIGKNNLTNYKQTNPSIASLLNMEYLHALEDEFGSNFDYEPLNFMIRNSRVVEQLHRIGYRVDTFATGTTATENIISDKFFHPAICLNEFEMLVISSTPLGFIMNDVLHNLHREEIRYAMEHIVEAGAQPGPDFVFTHLLSPHPPFVFGPNGESITPDHPYSTFDASDFMKFGTVEEYRTGYSNQVSYINNQALEIIQEILSTSTTPPIIIIQGDHGPGANFNHLVLDIDNLAERYPILYAAYIPCGSVIPFPDDITPVNSFRYIFNSCFETDLPYLDNREYFSSTLTPYVFTDVTIYLSSTR